MSLLCPNLRGWCVGQHLFLVNHFPENAGRVFWEVFFSDFYFLSGISQDPFSLRGSLLGGSALSTEDRISSSISPLLLPAHFLHRLPRNAALVFCILAFPRTHSVSLFWFYALDNFWPSLLSSLLEFCVEHSHLVSESSVFLV